MRTIILRVDNSLHRRMFKDKERLGLNWEQYISYLFGFKEGEIKLK